MQVIKTTFFSTAFSFDFIGSQLTTKQQKSKKETSSEINELIINSCDNHKLAIHTLKHAKTAVHHHHHLFEKQLD
jgi:hypothetical protein